MKRTIKIILLSLLLPLSNLFAQDDFTGPSEFEFNQSRFQAFYLFLEGSVDGNPLEEGDWIAAFNNDLGIGSQAWTGEYTALPIMCDDGSIWTVGYLGIGYVDDSDPIARFDISSRLILILDGPKTSIITKYRAHKECAL